MDCPSVASALLMCRVEPAAKGGQAAAAAVDCSIVLLCITLHVRPFSSHSFCGACAPPTATMCRLNTHTINRYYEVAPGEEGAEGLLRACGVAPLPEDLITPPACMTCRYGEHVFDFWDAMLQWCLNQVRGTRLIGNSA